MKRPLPFTELRLAAVLLIAFGGALAVGAGLARLAIAWIGWR